MIFSSVGPILGGITKTVAHLMRPLRSLGWILIEDSVLLPGAPVRPGFETHVELDETRQRIEKSGAKIVTTYKSGSEAQGDDADMSRIVRRAAALVARRPDLADPVARYVDQQREEYAFLERWTKDVTWLLRTPST